jgi:Domain of unknown function (DUF5658)
MRRHGWTRARVGLAIAFLTVSPLAVSAQGGPFDTPSPDAVSGAPETPSKWGAPPVQISGYVAYAALQALDVISTLQALRTPGTYEANPMYAGVVDSPAKFIALKSAATVATIVYMQHFSKSHPKASVFVMAGINSAYLFAPT